LFGMARHATTPARLDGVGRGTRGAASRFS
jgi:hypothetical protein